MNTSLFGTDGIRAHVGTSPLTMHELPVLGRAIAHWIQEKYGPTSNLLLISDTRASTHFIKSALQTGLLLSSLTIYDGGIMPTPAAYAFTHQNKHFHCSIVISASHNPWHDNGIKIIDRDQGKITDDDQERITSLFFSLYKHKNLLSSEYITCGTLVPWPQVQQAYIDYIIQSFNPFFLQNKTIILDLAHGATSFVAPAIFTHFGAHVIPINNTPNGTNINYQCGAVYPAALQKAMLRYNADAGFAFDGDGDRLIAVTKNGEVKDGDDIIALLLDHPLYAHTKTVVGTIMSNSGLEVKLISQGRQLLRTPVGDKHIAQSLVSNQLFLGAEPSGHVILRDYMNTGDGIFAALRLLEALSVHNNWNMLSFTKYPQIHLTLSVSIKRDLTASPLAQIIANHERQLRNGRLVARYSGTENILRIMLEDSNQDLARTVSISLKKQLYNYGYV